MFCAVGHLSRLVAADHCRRELNLWVCDAAGPHWNVAFIWPSSSSLLLMANKMPLLCQMFQRIWPKPPGLGGQWMPRWGARTYLIILESPVISHMMRVLLKCVFFPIWLRWETRAAPSAWKWVRRRHRLWQQQTTTWRQQLQWDKEPPPLSPLPSFPPPSPLPGGQTQHSSPHSCQPALPPRVGDPLLYLRLSMQYKYTNA